jgi:NADH:ubiquinone oxidoreductase subunit 6 (subunit J)
MLNLKLAELIDTYSNLMPIGFFIGCFFIYQFLFLFRFSFGFLNCFDESSLIFLSDFVNSFVTSTEFFNINSTLSNLRIIGLVIFSDFLFHFLAASMVLLLAMIAVIVLTLQKHYVSKTQNIYKQVLKDHNFVTIALS